MCNQVPNDIRSWISFYLCEQITAEEAASWLEASCRAINLLALIHITTNCVQWYTPARCMCQHRYTMFTFFFHQEWVQRAQSASKCSKSLLSYSANDWGAVFRGIYACCMHQQTYSMFIQAFANYTATGEKEPWPSARTRSLRSNAEIQPHEPPLWTQFFTSNRHI